MRCGGGKGECHPAMDAKLDPSPSASMQVIDDVLAPKDKKIEYPKEIILLQDQRAAEWSFYPRGGNLHTYHKGKKCHFNGIFLANQRCSTEISLAKCFGSKKYGINLRNGLPQLSPGDKPYFRSEQSSDFYKLGSSMPLVNFSRKPYTKKVDTFIPLEPLPKERHLPFSVREKRKQKLNEIMEVEKLDSWNPAVPILTWLFPPLPIQKRVDHSFVHQKSGMVGELGNEPSRISQLGKLQVSSVTFPNLL
uniref:Spermatogenesis associated serine rich 1 n=1 Tax=Monodelphis domestica TaxID=13616 RepID=A0A5F8HG50_MONDO